MSPEAPLEIAERALHAALDAGAREAEAICTIARRFSAQARDTEIEKLEQSTGRAVSLRVFAGEPGALRRATLSTSDLTLEGIRSFAARIVEAARHVAPDPFAGLPDPVKVTPDAAEGLEIDAADVPQRADEAKLQDALALERETRAVDPRIDNSNGSAVTDAVVTLGFANSHGLRYAYRQTSASRSASPVARDGELKRTGAYGTAGRSWAACEDVTTVARQAARRTLEMFGACPLPTQKLPVIFERDVAASVLSDLFAAVAASNVAIENSYLAGRIGEKIGSDLLTVIDDGRLRGALGTSPFDAEGVPTGRTVVFEAGVLRSFLFDTYYARKLGARTTANASGSGVGPNNFFLAPGVGTLEELIGRTRRGILILGTIGFATEYATGTYSRGAHGILIEHGELTIPVEGITIAADMPSMLGAIDDVAGDLRFDGQIVAPSFRVAEMTVSGT